MSLVWVLVLGSESGFRRGVVVGFQYLAQGRVSRPWSGSGFGAGDQDWD
ncbi:hypothetical protein TIFTF001_013895 [Ficus carica]|uniref:Uncharacterized protein n=1 Tax=Ficus carica TaxID=3494 RepID=A0AA88D6G6_FICCA|nr:hypothetical protein TIFTF001_013895 [Ficus carica]